MNAGPPIDEREAVAQQRYMAMNLARIAAIAVTIAGIAGTRDLLPLPYALSVGLLIVGVLAFFFAPPVLVKRWKAQDRLAESSEGSEGPK